MAKENERKRQPIQLSTAVAEDFQEYLRLAEAGNMKVGKAQLCTAALLSFWQRNAEDQYRLIQEAAGYTNARAKIGGVPWHHRGAWNVVPQAETVKDAAEVEAELPAAPEKRRKPRGKRRRKRATGS